MKRMLVVMIAVLLTMMIAGCVHSTGGVAPSNIPLAPGSYKELAIVGGKDCVYYLFGVIPLTGGNETRTALNRALLSRPGTMALVNVTADTYSQFFIVFSRTCTQVYGTAVRIQ